MSIQIASPASSPSNAPTTADRPIAPAMMRGAACRCPACGEGAMFGAYLKVKDTCGTCGEELHHHRADDAPPYFTIFIAGKIIVALVLAVEQAFVLETWMHTLIWPPVIVALCLWMLPRVKGALVGLQWALRMHGFGGPGNDEYAPDPAAEIAPERSRS